MNGSLTDFERSVSRVYNQTKRAKQDLKYTHYEFMSLCKAEFYDALTAMKVTDGGGCLHNDYATRFNRTKKKCASSGTSAEEAIAKFDHIRISRIGHSMATELAKDL